MYTFVVIELDGDNEPSVIAHVDHINKANGIRQEFADNNPERIYHVLMIPKVRKS